jgi:hypothetical protein
MRCFLLGERGEGVIHEPRMAFQGPQGERGPSLSSYLFPTLETAKTTSDTCNMVCFTISTAAGSTFKAKSGYFVPPYSGRSLRPVQIWGQVRTRGSLCEYSCRRNRA